MGFSTPQTWLLRQLKYMCSGPWTRLGTLSSSFRLPGGPNGVNVEFEQYEDVGSFRCKAILQVGARGIEGPGVGSIWIPFPWYFSAGGNCLFHSWGLYINKSEIQKTRNPHILRSLMVTCRMWMFGRRHQKGMALTMKHHGLVFTLAPIEPAQMQHHRSLSR